MKNKIEYIAALRGYVVTEDGILLNPKGIKIAGYLNHMGYYKTQIRVKGVITELCPHRLQAFQKYGNKLFEKGIIVRHLNGISTDNSWDNILVGTQSDNMLDIPEQIRIKKAKYAASFIKKYDKTEVREYYSLTNSYKKTMEKFNISSKGTLHYILNK